MYITVYLLNISAEKNKIILYSIITRKIMMHYVLSKCINLTNRAECIAAEEQTNITFCCTLHYNKENQRTMNGVHCVTTSS